MLQFSSGTRQQLPPQLFEQIGHYRREVFINQLGWTLNTVNGMELDEFDGPDAVYVCSQDDEGYVNGVARLLPTTGPYLMEKVFPQLWASQKIPRDPAIWELSRFATAKRVSNPRKGNTLSPTLSSNLLKRVSTTASSHGASSMITVSPVSMERLLTANGFDSIRCGTPMVVNDEPIVALQILCR